MLFRLATVAQHPVFYSIDADEGLPSNEVYQLVQDDFGYIWIGCDAGLYRYDGFTFKQYKNSNQNSRSVSSLQLDKEGRIWCRNFTGQILRVSGDSLLLIADLSTDTLMNNQYTLDDESNAWLFRNSYLLQVNERGEVLQKIKLPGIAHPNYIAHYKSQTYITLKNGTVFYYDQRTGKFLQLTSTDDLTSRVNAFFVWNDTLRLFSTKNGRNFLISTIHAGRVNREHEYYSTNENSRIHELMPDADGRLWVCTTNGAFIFTKKIKHLHEHTGYFKNYKVSYVLKDKEGLYWTSTLQDGLLVCPSLQTRVWNKSNSSLREETLTAVAAFNDQLMIGTYTGSLASINPSTTHIRYLDDATPTLTTKKILPYGNAVYSSHGPLTQVDNTYRVQHLRPSNLRDFAIANDSIYYVYPDAVEAISLEDAKTERPTSRKMLPVGGRSVVYAPSEDALYYALSDGLFRYRQGRWEEIRQGILKIRAMSLSHNSGIVWVASLSDGILAVKDAKVVQVVDGKSGLLEREIKCIKATDSVVWASGRMGLYRINKSDFHVDVFTTTQGFNPIDINSIEILSNNVYLATNKGLVEMPTQELSFNAVQPRLAIVSLFCNGERTDQRQEGAELPYYNSDLQIEFSSAAFKSRGKFTYEYRLVGLSNEWNTLPGVSPRVVYSSLPPGGYQFEVRAVNESGVKSEVHTVVVNVARAFWQTWWFYLGVSVVSMLIVVLVYSWRIRFVKDQAAITNRLTASQLTALKAQMNPHFMYNALNSIQDLVTNRDVKNSNLYLSKFSLLMRKVLDASGADEISLQEEIDILTLYMELEKLRFGDEFTYEIKADTALQSATVYMPSMILQPFVENAIKHGLLHKRGQKHIAIEFIRGERLECIITDNGVGRKRSTEIKNRLSEKHASFSTQATEKRIELLTNYANKKFDFEIIDQYENELPSGTKVVVRIPLSSS